VRAGTILDFRIKKPMIVTSAKYHHKTSYDRHKMTGHFLDWENQPNVYKTYPDVVQLQLSRDVRFPEIKLSSLVKKTGIENNGIQSLSSEDLSLIFVLTYSVTAKSRHAGNEFVYRAVASAGALYPVEMYVSLQGVNGLDDGLYHFSVARHGLNLLRKEDQSGSLLGAPGPPGSKTSLLTFFFSAIFFRSAWKYRERAYRYHLLDTGHLAEHLILALKALGLPFALSFDFDDSRVNRFLGFDEAKEVSLAMCGTPGTSFFGKKGGEQIAEMPRHIKNASSVSRKETNYSAIREIHLAGKEVASQLSPATHRVHEIGVTAEAWTRIEPRSAWPETMSYAQSVIARRSRRNFVPKPLSSGCLISLLDSLCAADPEDTAIPENHDTSICTGFMTGNVRGFDSGFYLLDTRSASFGMVTPDLSMDSMARICLDQEWLANAAVHFLFMANLSQLDRVWGVRGYRYAMLTAGRLGERLYLSTTAMGVGCCGIGAFYDFEAAELLGLGSESRLLYLVAVGHVKTQLS